MPTGSIVTQGGYFAEHLEAQVGVRMGRRANFGAHELRPADGLRLAHHVCDGVSEHAIVGVARGISTTRALWHVCRGSRGSVAA